MAFIWSSYILSCEAAAVREVLALFFNIVILDLPQLQYLGYII